MTWLKKLFKLLSQHIIVCFHNKKLPDYTSHITKPFKYPKSKYFTFAIHLSNKFWPKFPVAAMADSFVLEVAAEAASSTLFIFCCFNLIILIILFTSSPVFSSFHHQNGDDFDMPLSIAIHSNTHTQQNFMLQKNATVDEPEPDRCMNFNCSDNVEDDDHEEDEEDFRRRVEEFIEKVNRGWRQERQRTSRSVK